MQPSTYFSPVSKSNYHTLPHKHDHHSLGTYQSGFAPGSPKSNFELYRIEQRPTSQNTSFNLNKQTPSYLPDHKTYQSDNVPKTLRNFPQKTTPFHTLEASQTRFGDLKASYMGPDSREAAYIKESSNQSFKTPKKMPRPSELILVMDESSESATKPEDSTQSSFRSKKQGPFSTPTNNSTASSKKLDPIQRMKMRKSSIDPTEGWMRPVAKKKEKKWSLHDFQKIDELGSGKYGKVFLAKEKQTQFLCALKIIQKQMLKQEQITEQFIRELKIQLFLNHPNVIKMYGYFDDQINIYIIMEVALGGQLYKHMKKGSPMPEPKVAMIMRQVVSAVNELHSNQIIHRDLKPQNIVLNEVPNIVKLCDFGWSVYHGQTLRSTFCGTPLYVSPEILKGNSYDQKIDIWSLGIMLYEMLTGENPFKITQQQQLIKIVKDAITFPTYAHISSEAKDLIMCCLQKNPSDRKNIRELMHHQFFKKYPEKTTSKVGM